MSGLYIHVPFCESKCAYCDFYTLGKRDANLQDQYVKALLNEWTVRKEAIDNTIRTIYIGGGTPSLLTPRQLTLIASAIPPANSVEEFTIEVNPEDVNYEFAQLIEDLGINRVSMGIQSFDDAQLKLVGRRHTAHRAQEAFSILRKAGINNISCDLIFGLPGQTLRSWKESLNRLIGMDPDHISAYILSYEPGTRLYAMKRRGLVAEADDSLIEDMYAFLCQAMREAGYEHYEISNYAKPGFRSRHNSSYWDYTPYLGLGPGAHSFYDSKRWCNTPDIRGYIRADGLLFESESIDSVQQINERIMLGLRTKEGLLIDERFRESGVMDDARPFIDSGILIACDNRLSFDEKHWLISDMVISELFKDQS